MQRTVSTNSQKQGNDISRLVGKFLRGENWKKLVQNELSQPSKETSNPPMEEDSTTLTRFQITQKLNKTDNLDEAKKYIKMLYPNMTEEELQKWAKEIISIK